MGEIRNVGATRSRREPGANAEQKRAYPLVRSNATRGSRCAFERKITNRGAHSPCTHALTSVSRGRRLERKNAAAIDCVAASVDAIRTTCPSHLSSPVRAGDSPRTNLISIRVSTSSGSLARNRTPERLMLIVTPSIQSSSPARRHRSEVSAGIGGRAWVVNLSANRDCRTRHRVPCTRVRVAQSPRTTRLAQRRYRGADHVKTSP